MILLRLRLPWVPRPAQLKYNRRQVCIANGWLLNSPHLSATEGVVAVPPEDAANIDEGAHNLYFHNSCMFFCCSSLHSICGQSTIQATQRYYCIPLLPISYSRKQDIRHGQYSAGCEADARQPYVKDSIIFSRWRRMKKKDIHIFCLSVSLPESETLISAEW